jgi:hypothetical protein
VSPECRDELRSDLSLIGTSIEGGVVRSRAAAAKSTWGIWQRFCVDEFLSCGTDPLNVLPFFAQTIATGALPERETRTISNTGGRGPLGGSGLRPARAPIPAFKYFGFYRLSYATHATPPT